MSIYKIDEMYSRRISFVKCLSILMIVLIHAHSFSNDMTDPLLQNFIYLIREPLTYAAVPLFFMMSSILLYKKDFSWVDNMKKKCKSILLPYLFWNTLCVLFFYVTQNVSFTNSFFSSEMNMVGSWGVKEWIDAYFFVFNRQTPLLYPLWFLRDLFVLNIFSKVLKKIIDFAPIPVLIFVLLYWFSGYNIKLLNRDSIFAFVLGYYFVKYNKDFTFVDKVYTWIPLLSWLIFGVLATMVKNIQLFDYISIFSGIILVIKVSKCVNDNTKIVRFLLYLSSYSTFIYFFHEESEAIMIRLVQRVIPQTSITIFLEFFIIPVIVVLWCYIVARLLQKFMPKLYSALIGFR